MVQSETKFLRSHSRKLGTERRIQLHRPAVIVKSCDRAINQPFAIRDCVAWAELCSVHDEPQSELRRRFQASGQRCDKSIGVRSTKCVPDRTRRTIVGQLSGYAIPGCNRLGRLPRAPSPIDRVAIVMKVASNQFNRNWRLRNGAGPLLKPQGSHPAWHRFEQVGEEAVLSIGDMRLSAVVKAREHRAHRHLDLRERFLEFSLNIPLPVVPLHTAELDPISRPELDRCSPHTNVKRSQSAPDRFSTLSTSQLSSPDLRCRAPRSVDRPLIPTVHLRTRPHKNYDSNARVSPSEISAGASPFSIMNVNSALIATCAASSCTIVGAFGSLKGWSLFSIADT